MTNACITPNLKGMVIYGHADTDGSHDGLGVCAAVSTVMNLLAVYHKLFPEAFILLDLDDGKATMRLQEKIPKSLDIFLQATVIMFEKLQENHGGYFRFTRDTSDYRTSVIQELI